MKRHRHSSAARRGGIIVIIIAVVGALAIGAGVTYFVFGRSKAAKQADKKDDGKAGEKDEGKKDEGKEKESEGEELAYVNMGAFLVNIVSQGELRYLRIEVTLAAKLPAEKEKKGKKKEGGHGGGGGKDEGPKLPAADDAIARDVIVRVLSVQSFDELRQGDRFGLLSKQLLEALQQNVETCEIQKVLFTSITMQ